MGLYHHAGNGYSDSMYDANIREVVIKAAINTLTAYKSKFDVIVCTGYSGMVIAPIVAYAINKPLLIVRKDGESAHSCLKVMGQLGDRYVIVDDFVCTGATVKRIIKEVKVRHKNGSLPAPKFVGMYLYEDISTGEYNDIPRWRDKQ